MKTLQPTLLLLLVVPLTKPAPPTQQDSHISYDYGTDNLEETLFSQDFEDKYLQGKNIKEKETMIIPDEKSVQLQKDESVTPLPPKKENDEIKKFTSGYGKQWNFISNDKVKYALGMRMISHPTLWVRNVEQEHLRTKAHSQFKHYKMCAFVYI